MKKIIILLLLFVHVSLYSMGYLFTLGDDLLAMNLFTPIQNARTFSFYTTTPLIYGTELELDYSLFTNDISDSRVDEATILLSYPINNFEIMSIKPSIGLTITGNLSGSNLENTISKIVSNGNRSDIPDEEKIHNYFYTSILFSKDTELINSNVNSSILFSRIYSKIEAITNYTISACIGYSLLFTANNFVTDLGYSYGYRYNLTDFNTVNYVKNLEDEGKLNLTITAGDFRYELNLFLDGSFSTGKYSINFGKLPVGSELTMINLKITPGSEYDIASDKFLSSLQIDVTPFNWAFSRYEVQLKSTYGWNKPHFKNKNLKSLYYEETYYNKLTLGVNTNLIENFSPYWINPYIGIGFGVENYRYYEDSDSTHIIPIFEIKTGFNILLPQFFIKDNIQYGINGNLTYRDALGVIEFQNNFLINLGILVAIEL